jgi:hypothetical protein
MSQNNTNVDVPRGSLVPGKYPLQVARYYTQPRINGKVRMARVIMNFDELEAIRHNKA